MRCRSQRGDRTRKFTKQEVNFLGEQANCYQATPALVGQGRELRDHKGTAAKASSGAAPGRGFAGPDGHSPQLGTAEDLIGSG